MSSSFNKVALLHEAIKIPSWFNGCINITPLEQSINIRFRLPAIISPTNCLPIHLRAD